MAVESANNRNAFPTLAWCLAAALILTGVGALSLMSDRLSPLQPPATRPLGWAFLCLSLSWGGFAWACYLAIATKGRTRIGLIILVALLARGFFLWSDLIQSDDCYRYALDGRAVVEGINPFSFVPAELYDRPSDKLIGTQPDKARFIIEHVNNPQVRTIYPPLAQSAFALGAVLTPWDVAGQRWVFLFFDLTTLAVLLLLLGRLGKPIGWIVLYAWNPLVIKEIANTAHMDSLPALFLVLLAAVLAVRRIREKVAWSLLAGVLMGGAILSKLYPLILLPVCLVWLAGGRRAYLRVAAFLLAVAVTVVAGYWPFKDTGLDKLVEGLRTYSQHWWNNPGMFVILQGLFDEPRRWLVAIVGVVTVVAAVRLWFSQRQVDDLVRAWQWPLLTALLLAPAFFPWYLVGLLAISVLRPRSWAVVLTGACGLYYLLRHVEAQGYAPAWQYATLAVEHGLIWAWLAGSAGRAIFLQKRGGHSEPAPL